MNKRQLVYLEKARSYALSKEGMCLSDVYHTIKEPIQWKCKEGHEWERNYEKTVNRGIWCTACFNAERDSLAEAIVESTTVEPDTVEPDVITPIIVVPAIVEPLYIEPVMIETPRPIQPTRSFPLLASYEMAYYPFAFIQEEYKKRNIIL